MPSHPNSASTTGTNTPTSSQGPSQSSSSYLSYPVTHIASSLYRRLTEPSLHRPAPLKAPSNTSLNDMRNGVYTPPHRTASPFQPPPLTPLTLSGLTESSILSRAVAEEIRLLVPPRLQLADIWKLAYSLENDGVSLATLYNKCSSPRIPRGSSFILVIQDGAGGVRSCFPLTPVSTSTDSQVTNIKQSRHQTDLRRIPNRRAQTLPLLLRHRRMFPLARLNPRLHNQHHSPLQPPSTTLGPRHRNRINGPLDHNRFSDTYLILIIITSIPPRP